MSYGIFHKKGWRCIMVFFDEERAWASIRGREQFLEVREIIEDDTRKKTKTNTRNKKDNTK